MKINNNKLKSLFVLSLVGSGLGKYEKANNQTGIAKLNSLPKLASNLTEKGNDSNQTLLFFAGYPISLGVDANVNRVLKHFTKYCTTGFVVVNTNSSQCTRFSNDYGGFLTSNFCWPAALGTLSSEVYNWNGSVLLGNFRYGTLKDYTIDYNYISNDGAWDAELTPFVVGGGSDDESKFQLYPVTGVAYVELGYRVCAYGVVSGYNCGNLTEIDVELTIPTPWDIINDDGSPNFLTLSGLSKVDLGTNGFYAEEDLGGPVYTESNIGDQKVAWALGYITNFDNSDPNHKFLYYTQLDKALSKIFDDNSCSYTLMTYNETNAQKYDQLLAQVEIPPKK